MKNDYDFAQAVADAILDVEGAVIFGGYVRDKIRHDHFAQLFYESEEAKECYTRTMQELYDDANFLPEYRDRRLTPCDIDCFMKTSSIENLETRLKRDGLKLVRCRDNMAVFDAYADENTNIQLLKCKIKFDFSEVPVLEQMLPLHLRKMCMHVDIVHADDTRGLEPPFQCVDFMCNGLILDHTRQVRAASHIVKEEKSMVAKHRVVGEIIDDILHHKARMMGTPPRMRVRKMEMKGYDVITEDMSYTLAVNTNEDDTCIICHDALKSRMSMTRSCCAAHYHRKCYVKMLKTDNFAHKCPMCRDTFFGTEKEDVIRMFDYV